MKLILLNILVLLIAEQLCPAQETFKLQTASREYDVVVTVKACGEEEQRRDPNTCNGPASFSLYGKGAKAPFQVLRLRHIELYKDTLVYNPQITKKPRGVYEEEYSVVFDDFDFDGKQDLAICNGRNGGYGSPSYNVYLFDNRSKKFTANGKLTRLTEGVYLGLFFPDAKERLLIAFSKSGCCYMRRKNIEWSTTARSW